MQGTITQQLAGVGSAADRTALLAILSAVGDRLSTQSFTDAGLVIKAGGSAVVKTGSSALYLSIKGKLVTKAASTDMAALSGTVTNAKFNIFQFFIDGAGTLTSAMGTEGATLGDVKWPALPEGKASIGFVIINPTGTGNFVGGTTALDDATVVPNAAYVSTDAPFDPTVVIS
jgi:hypothetical protein